MIAVINQQYYLTICNYGAPDRDGIKGPDTERCIDIARAANGLTVGCWDVEIEGCAYNQVLSYQKIWENLGYSLICDGIAGPETYAVARAWQCDNELTIDGIIGEISYPILMSDRSNGPQHWDGPNHYNGAELWPNFSPDEFVCACGCGGDVCDELKQRVQLTRDILSDACGCDRPLYVTSGFRCPPENERQGGVPDSLHMEGLAADVYTPGMTRDMVNRIVDAGHSAGLTCGTYYLSHFVHLQLGGHDFNGD